MMTTFLNKNKALALSTISVAILLIFSTIAVCSFCGCASTKESKRTLLPPRSSMSTQLPHTFKFDEIQGKNRMYTMDIVLYDEEGHVEKVYTPIINTPDTTCNSN